MIVGVGKAKVEVSVRGCVGCGIPWSSGWRVVRQVPVRIGRREGGVEVQMCADCTSRAVVGSPSLFDQGA